MLVWSGMSTDAKERKYQEYLKTLGTKQQTFGPDPAEVATPAAPATPSPATTTPAPAPQPAQQTDMSTLVREGSDLFHLRKQSLKLFY